MVKYHIVSFKFPNFQFDISFIENVVKSKKCNMSFKGKFTTFLLSVTGEKCENNLFYHFCVINGEVDKTCCLCVGTCYLASPTCKQRPCDSIQ